MSQPSGTQSDTPPADNTPPLNPPAQTAQQPVQHSENEPVWATELKTHLTALPEQMAKSIKEAIGTPKAPEAKQPDSSSSQSNAGESKEVKEVKDNQEPGTNKSGSSSPRTRFADWWFKG